MQPPTVPQFDNPDPDTYDESMLMLFPRAHMVTEALLAEEWERRSARWKQRQLREHLSHIDQLPSFKVKRGRF